MNKDILKKKYNWLNNLNSVEDYLPPEYYKKLLRQYAFNNISDLALLENFVRNISASKILELGCGSGRASKVVTKLLPDAGYTFSDLSERMLDAAKLSLGEGYNFILSDAIEYMEKTEEKFDFVYSLWSFSHSVHQHFHRLDRSRAVKYITTVLNKFIKENINPKGSFFLIHFDSLSDEQRILMKQWKRIFPTFRKNNQQSPSKQIIDQILLKLDNQGVINQSILHLKGDPILYMTENELLEIFMNFHLETYFNASPFAAEVIEDIKEQAKKYRKLNGTYSITPGCYLYTFIKN